MGYTPVCILLLTVLLTGAVQVITIFIITSKIVSNLLRKSPRLSYLSL